MSFSSLLLSYFFLFFYQPFFLRYDTMFSVAAFASLLALAGSSFAQEGAAAPSSVAQLVAQLREAPTEVDRLNLVPNEQFLFDFVNPNTTVGVTNGAGGHTVAATSENFPAVVGNGVSMSTFSRYRFTFFSSDVRLQPSVSSVPAA